ncbi:hypothetical protein ACN28I_00050 [Archangium gephyra]|uniref:hypothetical protein n=1 Tax=Archangium gephyra TaxID=48 RepID=UPI003B7B2D30
MGFLLELFGRLMLGSFKKAIVSDLEAMVGYLEGPEKGLSPPPALHEHREPEQPQGAEGEERPEPQPRSAVGEGDAVGARGHPHPAHRKGRAGWAWAIRPGSRSTRRSRRR